MSNFLVNESVWGGGWLEVGVVVGLVWPVAKEGPFFPIQYACVLCVLSPFPSCLYMYGRVEYLFSVFYVAVYNVRPEGIT